MKIEKAPYITELLKIELRYMISFQGLSQEKEDGMSYLMVLI